MKGVVVREFGQLDFAALLEIAAYIQRPYLIIDSVKGFLDDSTEAGSAKFTHRSRDRECLHGKDHKAAFRQRVFERFL